jgi:hypothetical protein
VVVDPTLFVGGTGRGEPIGVRGFLLGDELLDLLGDLLGTRERECGVRSIALPIDTRAVHRDEKAGVRVLFCDCGDAGAVEREMRWHSDVEEVDRFPGPGLDQRRLLPDGPAVVVALGREHDRVVSFVAVGPRARESSGEVGVVGLKHDLP